MATTTNYSWATPDDTDLVKDGAAAIRTLGSSIDTTTKALNPSTTLGDIEYRSSTANTNTRLGIGTTGQLLTVAGGVPSWANAPAAGGMTLLQTLDLSGVATVTSSSIAGTYNNLVFVIKDVYFPGGTNATLGMRFNSDTGNNYTYRGFFQQGAGTASGDDATNAAQHSILDAASSTGKDAGQGSITVYRYTDTSGVISQTNTYGHINGPTTRAYSRTNYYNGASAISTVTFFYIQGGGNWSNGTIYVYGVK